MCWNNNVIRLPKTCFFLSGLLYISGLKCIVLVKIDPETAPHVWLLLPFQANSARLAGHLCFYLQPQPHRGPPVQGQPAREEAICPICPAATKAREYLVHSETTLLLCVHTQLSSRHSPRYPNPVPCVSTSPRARG